MPAVEAHPRAAVDLEVILPALNEEARLGASLRSLVIQLERLPGSSAVVVVDNGSVDGTAEIAATWPGGPVAVHVIGCSQRGRALAIRRGVLSSRARLVGVCDVDPATPATDLHRMVARLRQGDDVVVARCQRRHWRVRAPGSGRAGGAIGSLTHLLRSHPHDAEGSLQLFRLAAARTLVSTVPPGAVGYDRELVSLARRLGLSVSEIPLATAGGGHSCCQACDRALVTAVG